MALGKGSVNFDGMATREAFGKAGHLPDAKEDHDGLTSAATVDVHKRQKSLGHIARPDRGHLRLQKMSKRNPSAIIGKNQWITNIEEENK